jgi:hypothetical protein
MSAQDASKMTGASQCLTLAANDDESSALRKSTEDRCDIASDQLRPDDDRRELLLDEFDDLGQHAPSRASFARRRVDSTTVRGRGASQAPARLFAHYVYRDEFDLAASRLSGGPANGGARVFVRANPDDDRRNRGHSTCG